MKDLASLAKISKKFFLCLLLFFSVIRNGLYIEGMALNVKGRSS